MKIISAALISIFGLTMSGCAASIPPESVELSQSIGNMIISAKVAHVNMVNSHFGNLREEVDNFAMSEYKEAFLNNVRKLLKQKDSNFTELSFEQYDKAMVRVFKKRSEWMDEVEKNREQVLEALEEHYSVLLATNAQVTSLLRSAVKLSETQAAILGSLNVKTDGVNKKIKEMEDKLMEGSTTIHSLMDNAVKQIGG